MENAQTQELTTNERMLADNLTEEYMELFMETGEYCWTDLHRDLRHEGFLESHAKDIALFLESRITDYENDI